MKEIKKPQDYNFLFVAFAILFVCWQIKNYTGLPGAGLDPSWQLALNWAHLKGLQWGKDILFTYGPLSYLFLPLAGFSNYAEVTIINNAITIFSSLAIIALFFRNSKTTAHLIGAVFISILFIVYNSVYVYELSAFLAMFIIQTSLLNDNAKERGCFLVIAFFMLSLVQFIKSSFVMIAWSLIFCVVLFCLCRKKYIDALLAFTSYMIFSILLWIAGGQNVSNLPGFFCGAISISSGYTEAMQLSILSHGIGLPLLLYAWVCLGVYIKYLVGSLYRKNWLCFINLLLPGPYLFLTFKEAFVRSDGHIFHLLQVFPFICIYFLYILFYSNNWLKKHGQFFENITNKRIQISLGFVIAFVIIGLASSFHIYPIALYPFSQGVNDKQNIKHNIKRAIGQTIVTDQLKRQIRDKYAVDGDVLKNIMLSDRVDIFPWDIALLYAYNMNWQPRPVFQSYSAYTHGLDDKNASFYYSGDSPDAVIYSFESIDGRYPFFDEPRTYRALLTNYAAQPYASENMFVLRKSTNFSSNEAQLKFIEEKHVNIGDFVELPQGTDGLIFAEINWNMTFLGKAMNFFFKTMFHKNPTTFSFRLSNGEVRTHRFIRDLGKNSLFVSGYLRNSSDAFHFFSGDFERNVDGFTINGTAYLYSKGYNVRFYELSPESAKQQR